MCNQIPKIKKNSQPRIKNYCEHPNSQNNPNHRVKRDNNDRSPQESSQPSKSIKMDNNNHPSEEITNLMIWDELNKINTRLNTQSQDLVKKTSPKLTPIYNWVLQISHRK